MFSTRPRGRDWKDGPAANGSGAGVVADEIGADAKVVEAKDWHNSRWQTKRIC
jgi:hypothetical protein